MSHGITQRHMRDHAMSPMSSCRIVSLEYVTSYHAALDCTVSCDIASCHLARPLRLLWWRPHGNTSRESKVVANGYLHRLRTVIQVGVPADSGPKPSRFRGYFFKTERVPSSNRALDGIWCSHLNQPLQCTATRKGRCGAVRITSR